LSEMGRRTVIKEIETGLSEREPRKENVMKRVVIMLMSAGLLAIWASAPVVADEHGDHSGYEKKARELSKDFESKIERLREEAKGLSGEARAEVEARIDRAQEKWDRAVKELNRMKAEQESAGTPGTWEKMKSTAASAYDQTQQAYNEAAVYLGLKSSQTDPEAKAELEKRIENYMEDLQTRLQAARQKAKDLPEDSRAEGKKLVETLREKWSRAEKELARMKDRGSAAGEEAWKEIKSGMSSALDELNRAYQSVEDYLDRKSS
jgi:uncharacterized protein YicC (UPF0701 family)